MPDGSDAFRAPSLTSTQPLRAAVDLRILSTTDLHMHLIPFDYLAHDRSAAAGLARVATLIARHRARTPNCLLFDNGDILQGSALGDHAASQAAGAFHPAIAAMNALGYDACALGNHDFSYGLRFLRRVMGQARFPVLAANLGVRRGKGFAPWALLHREVTDHEGGKVSLTIGVVGFLPPQTVEWDRDLSMQIVCADIVQTARQVVPQLRAHGADIVIALAHSGIGQAAAAPGAENAALALAGVQGIDAIIAGHTHQVFPGPDFAARDGVDPLRGTLAGKPAVMAGFGGSHLGVIDLRLEPEGGAGWRVAGFDARCEAVADTLPAQSAVTVPTMAAHHATLRGLKRRVARCATPLHSHFSVIGEDAGLRLVATAQRWHVRACLRDSPWRDLPILSAAAPFRAGGRGGPAYYTDIAAGRLSHRSLADLYAFPNRVAAVVMTGAQLSDWLERAASLFARITPGTRDGMLMDPDFPVYNFDVIDGLRWQIDLSRPARFSPDGRLIDDCAYRIGQMTWRERQVAPDQRFVLATNSYRLAGCGLFSPVVAAAQIVLNNTTQTRTALHRYLRRRRRVEVDCALGWRFAPLADSSVVFATGPGGPARLAESPAAIAGRLVHVGPCQNGFQRMRLML